MIGEPAQAQQVQDQARLKLEFHGQVLSPDQLQTAILSATQIYRVEAPHGDLHLFQLGQIERLERTFGRQRLEEHTVFRKLDPPGEHRAGNRFGIRIEADSSCPRDADEPLGEREVPSHVVGERVMERLRSLDAVAYVRFASVYRAFTDVGEFMSELEGLARRGVK